MKTKVEVEVTIPQGVSPTAIIDSIKVTLASIGVDVHALSASNDIITVRERYETKKEQC